MPLLATTLTMLAAHPTLPRDPHWAGAVLIVIAGLFLAAIVIGPVVRANMPEDVPPTHSHDEPPGTSHHHGEQGTDHSHR